MCSTVLDSSKIFFECLDHKLCARSFLKQELSGLSGFLDNSAQNRARFEKFLSIFFR